MPTYLIIILVTVIMSIMAWQNSNLMHKWILNPYQVIQRKQYLRMITSGFIHLDYMHLAFNMLTLYFFGRNLSAYMIYYLNDQYLLFAFFYFLALILSDLPVVFRHKDNHYYNSLGASGAVSAVVFACIILDPLNPVYLFFIPIGIPGFIYGFLYLGMEFYLNKRGGTGVNHEAHIYGGVFGLLFALIIFPSAGPNFIKQLSTWSLF